MKNDPKKKASRHLLYAVLGFGLGLAGLSGLVYALMPAQSSLAGASIGRSLTLIGHSGQAVKGEELAGRPYLVFFGYTHCPDFCPSALLDISEVFKQLGPDKKIAAVFVTVDPERDTPEVLRAYLENFDPRILGLTGDPKKTMDLAKAFRVYAKKVPRDNTSDYTVDHTGIVYLMDKRGRFVSAFNLQRPPQQAAHELESYL